MQNQLVNKRFTFMICALLLGGCIAAESIPGPAPASEDAAIHVGASHTEEGGVEASQSEGVNPAFDIVHAQVKREGAFIVFQQLLVAEAGSITPEVTGALAGAAVESYVWPTSLDTSTVGFEGEQGILSLAVTAHPDFDDTPLVDEDEDGDKLNDGRLWHSHWVVLVEDESCGPAGLKVKDIPEGQVPSVPETWPELPILIDSPNYDLELAEFQISVLVPHLPFADIQSFNYDGVTAGLRVNVDLHAPLLCVSEVYDIASDDLSLPGVVQ